jgi:DNA-binding response OmpR family regulator
MQRVLVMSDDAGELSWLRNEPSLQNYEIETVVENAEVLKLLRRRDFDVVVTNPRMPVKADLMLLAEMRRIRSGLRLIILAPETTPKDLISAMRAHVFAYFSAPYNAREVVAMINRAVEERDWKDGIEVLSATSNWIALRVSPRRLTAERLVRFMSELSSDLPDTEREELITAFREVLLNAMEHGAGFDPENLPHAAVSNISKDPLEHLQFRETHGMRPGGFGIMIANQLVDEVIYNEFCNEVLLIKHTS